MKNKESIIKEFRRRFVTSSPENKKIKTLWLVDSEIERLEEFWMDSKYPVDRDSEKTHPTEWRPTAEEEEIIKEVQKLRKARTELDTAARKDWTAEEFEAFIHTIREEAVREERYKILGMIQSPKRMKEIKPNSNEMYRQGYKQGWNELRAELRDHISQKEAKE